jgi:hypothetical protein
MRTTDLNVSWLASPSEVINLNPAIQALYICAVHGGVRCIFTFSITIFSCSSNELLQRYGVRLIRQLQALNSSAPVWTKLKVHAGAKLAMLKTGFDRARLCILPPSSLSETAQVFITPACGYQSTNDRFIPALDSDNSKHESVSWPLAINTNIRAPVAVHLCQEMKVIDQRGRRYELGTTSVWSIVRMRTMKLDISKTRSHVQRRFRVKHCHTLAAPSGYSRPRDA